MDLNEVLGEEMTDTAGHTTETDEVERIKNRVKLIVEQKFADGITPVYLSQLGNDIGEDRRLIEKITKKKFSDFIKDDLGFEIHAMGEHQNILYLVPPEYTTGQPESHKRHSPRYTKAFWAAFAKPIEEGERRFINLATHEFGADEETLRQRGGEIREISPSFTSPAEGSGSAMEIAERLERWLKEQELDPEPFLLRRRRPTSAGSMSLLDMLLNSLDVEQLKRVSLPLDVVRILNDRRPH
jgi:hypothetical protein